MAASSSDQTNENTVIAGSNVKIKPIADIKDVLHKLSNRSTTSENISVCETNTSSISKSSTEIISELFGAFNAEPPILTDTFLECANDNNKILISNSSEESPENALSSVRKSSKKKHKNKSKKRKKRSKSEKDSKARSKLASVKLKSMDDHSITSSDMRKEERKMFQEPADECVLISSDENQSQSEDITSRVVSTTNSGAGADSNLIITIDAKSVNSTNKDEPFSTFKGSDTSSKTTSKISIKNLKFSSVFEATIKEVEEQAKAKAEMYEEGEISNSSEEVQSEKNGHQSDDPISVSRINVISSAQEITIESKSKSKRNQSRSPDKKSSSSKRLKESKRESTRHSHRSSEDSRHRSRHHRLSKRTSRSRSRDSRSKRKIENGHKSHSRDRTSTNDDRKKNKSHDLREKLSEKRKNGHSHRKHSEDKQDVKRSEDKQDHVKRNEDKQDNGKHSEDKQDHGKQSNDKHDHGKRNDDKHDHSKRSDDKRDHRKRRRQHSTSPIDKKKLMAIARKNALLLLEQGALPGPIVQEKIVNIKAGGKSVAELTDFCKRLSKRETRVSGSEGENDDSGDSEVEKRPFHHPFQIKERPLNIVMNIRNSVPVPANALLNKASDQTLRVQFPVSSGSQHRKTESEWVPVEPKTLAPRQLLAITASEVPLSLPAPVAPPTVFPEPSEDPPKDIGNIVSQRLRAMRKLQENPNDVQALSAMYNANQEMKTWAESKQLPGQFTGSTDVRMLSVSELSGGAQAYVRKDQFVTAAPVTGGMGMSLLQKMGWRPGEGLGKNKGGSLEPLSLEIKMDKKGLVTREDLKHVPNARGGGRMNANNKSLSDKHPISLLIEFCTRRKWRPPHFEITHESGPDHKKNFLFKVQVNGVAYGPTNTSPNKKLAKAEAATACLRALGVPID